MDSIYDDAARRAARYARSVTARTVMPATGDVDRLAVLDIPLPERPTADTAVLQQLDEIGSPATVASTGGRYFGYVVGGSLPIATAAHWLATAWDQNVPNRAASPAAAAFESVALRWIIELLALPSETTGAFVSGSSLGNLCGLAAARHAVLAQAGWDVESQGLFGAPPVTVVVSDEVHASVIKALGLLGFGRERVQCVATDAQGRLRPECLPRFDGPAIVCAQAGNVNSGACDPFAAICDQAHSRGAWVHVDGAFGLWARASTQRRGLCDGVERADSWATDAHKWLNVPYDSGLVFVRDGRALRAAMSLSAPYLAAPDAAPSPAELTPELSRRARGVDAWAAIVSLGRSGVDELIERCCRHASRFAAGLAAAGYRVLNEVELNQVVVSFGSDEDTERVIDAIQRDGTCWCGLTHWRGIAAMRISVCSWATTDDDVERSLAAMLRCARL